MPIQAATRDAARLAPRGESDAPRVGDLLSGDHDWHAFSTTPSVIQVPDVPEDATQSFYSGRLFVALKDSALEASSPFRHVAELAQLLRALATEIGTISVKPVLVMYTDGGPDHRCTYLSIFSSYFLNSFRALLQPLIISPQVCN